MYKNKKMLSAIAAVAVLSSGAIAFDITMDLAQVNDANTHANANASELTDNETGYAYDSETGTIAYYKGGVYTDEKLELSDSLRGDALIYPAFSQDNGWETEITVRNVKDVAIIAKAVIYRDTDSREMLDFNIYLSAHDVARFKIKEGKVTTQDGSIIASLEGKGTVSNPADGVANDFVTEDALKDTSSEHIDKLIGVFDEKFKAGKETWPGGYVIVYGMMQAEANTTSYTDRNYDPEDLEDTGDKQDVNIDLDTDNNEDTPNVENRIAAMYHNNHAKLFYDYRKVLDKCRPGWREAYNGFFVNGMMSIRDIDNNPVFVNSPNVSPDCMHGIDNVDSEFRDTDPDALLGEVEISHPEGDKRNLLLPATALKNFTVDNMIMLWTEGEYAAIQDRRLSAGGTTSTSVYNIDGLREDAETFLIDHTYYTYKEGDASQDGEHRNTILLTQPMKRPLIQAGNQDRYWTVSNNPDDASFAGHWGYFEFDMKVYDENEREYSKEAGLVSITSPYSSSVDVDPYAMELQPIRDLEEQLPEDGEYFKFETNGYADIRIKNIPRKLPAIVTQMTSSRLGGESQTNWVYSPVNKASN